MRTRLPARLISLAALLPLLALAVSGFGYSRYRCSFTGVASEEACCPGEDASDAPVVSAASCCDHERGDIVHPPVEAAPSTTSVALAPAAQPHDLLVSPAVRVLPHGRTTDALGPPGPSLRLVKQSFLI
jgi:hypothetical protein